VNWALTGIAGVLTIGRFVIRGYNSRRLFWDDLVHLLAFVALVIHGALSVADGNDRVAIDHAKQEKTPASVLLGLYQRLAHVSAANNCFLYSVFWLVKIGFLLFYYRLFNISRNFRKAWWAVLAFTFLTYWVPIGGVISICGQSHTLADYGESPRQCHGLRHVDMHHRGLQWWKGQRATDPIVVQFRGECGD